MQIAAKLKGHNAESNAEDYAVTPDTDPVEGYGT